jgi:small subunit ribosomal protein S1
LASCRLVSTSSICRPGTFEPHEILGTLFATNFLMSTGDDSTKPADETNPATQGAANAPASPPAESSSATPDAANPEPAKQSIEKALDQPGPPADSAKPSSPGSTGTGPLSKLARGSGPLAARGLGVAKPASPAVDPAKLAEADAKKGDRPKQKKKKPPRPRLAGERGDGPSSEASTPEAARPSGPAERPGKISVPNTRQSLPDDIQAELDAALASADVEAMLAGSAGSSVRKEPLVEGARVHGQVLKIHDDNVFVSLGGPDEGVVPFEQFKVEPKPGDSVEVIVRGMNREDGLFALSLPGGAIEVSDWEDLDEGTVVEATVTGSNSGGLECKVGGVKGFIPISQISEYRVEDTSEFVDQKFLCVVTESNARRGNLVLSRRAVLEREREEKRKEQLEQIEAGDLLEGTVRSIKDFGAFVDLGGLDGLIHISKLSWERVKHPSEVLEVGQKVKVKVEKIDKDTAKISLSYRDLLENPWDSAEQEFAVGSVHKGVVTRVANFGCFVKLGPGVEGLVHVSELAHHRVSKVDAFVQEGQEVEVKILSFDRDAQKISLSIKAAQQSAAESEAKTSQEEEEPEPAREVAVRASHSGPLKGGNNRETGGERFGLRW